MFLLWRVYERAVLFLSKMVYKRAIGWTLGRSLPCVKLDVVVPRMHPSAQTLVKTEYLEEGDGTLMATPHELCF